MDRQNKYFISGVGGVTCRKQRDQIGRRREREGNEVIKWYFDWLGPWLPTRGMTLSIVIWKRVRVST